MIKYSYADGNCHFWPRLRKMSYLAFCEDETLRAANEVRPRNFENLLSVRGVGPKTIRALSLVSEIIYGAKPSYEDSARYSYAHGGKDGIPYPVDQESYDKSINVLQRAITKAKMDHSEKRQAFQKLHRFV